MVAGDTVIHGATVDDWRELAELNGWPHGTAKELSRFIDQFRKWWRTSTKNPEYLTELRRERRSQLREAEELIDKYESVGHAIGECKTWEEFNVLYEYADNLTQRLSSIADVMTGFEVWDSMRFIREEA